MFSTLTEFNETSVSTPVKVTETKIMQFILVKMYIFLLYGLYFWLFFFFFLTYYTVSSEPLKVLELFCKIHTTFRRNVTNYQKISSDYHTLPIRFFSVKCQVHDCFELNIPPPQLILDALTQQFDLSELSFPLNTSKQQWDRPYTIYAHLLYYLRLQDLNSPNSFSFSLVEFTVKYSDFQEFLHNNAPMQWGKFYVRGYLVIRLQLFINIFKNFS